MKPILIRPLLASASLALAAGLALAPAAQAKGCLKGAAIGGVGGHFAGHHTVLGAAAGCAVGHHEAHKHDRERAEQNRNAQQYDNGPAAGTDAAPQR